MSRTWDHFLFWSGFHNEQEEQAKKNLKNKQYSFVKGLKKELIDELVQDKVQENCSTQEFEEPMYEEVREVVNGNQEQVLENAEKEHRVVSKQEEEVGSLERNPSFTSVQESIKKILVEVKLIADNLQISNEKIRGKSVVTRLKDDGVQI